MDAPICLVVRPRWERNSAPWARRGLTIVGVAGVSGNGQRELAEVIARVAGYTGRFRFDPAKPDGMPRKVMKVDKKSRGDLLRFVVIENIGQPRILAGPSQGELMAAYSAIGGDDQ